MARTDIMVFLNGRDKAAFRCFCGCNVFHHPPPRRWPSDPPTENIYICNGCDTRYIGE